jgi:hypothetical protein
MEYNKWQNLIQKYLDAETTLEEEETLRTYFATEQNIPDEFKSLASVFKFTEAEKKQVQTKASLKRKFYPKFMWSAAASFILLLTMGFYLHHEQQQKKEIELAFAETQRALLMLSEHLNTGMQQMNHLKEFNSTTEIILKQQ